MRQYTYRGDGALDRDEINVLDCAYCGEWFPTFERLAKHVYARHTGAAISGAPSSRRQAVSKKPAAKKRTRGGIPAPSGEAPATLNPFLKAEHIGRREGASATLKLVAETPRVVDGNFGEQIIVGVALNGKRFDWAITIDSVNHRLMFDRFGADPGRWKGSVKVAVKTARESGRNYIAVI